jgi:hypothetical protein
MNSWMKGTTYSPTNSLFKRNVGIQGLSPTGQKGMGAFGAALTGAGNQMMGKPQQQFAAPKMDDIGGMLGGGLGEMINQGIGKVRGAFGMGGGPQGGPGAPTTAPAGAPQPGSGSSAGAGAFAPGGQIPRQFAPGGFLDYLRNR